MFCLSSFLSLLCTGIREERPSRELLKDYFAVGTPQSRHWHGLSLAQAVLKGLQLSERHPEKAPFMWLTAYNSGASRVALAALSLLGISEEDLDEGFPSDPDASPDPKFFTVLSPKFLLSSLPLCFVGSALFTDCSYVFLDVHHRYRLRILARPGLLIRLTQNLDKARGFVNGASSLQHEPFFFCWCPTFGWGWALCTMFLISPSFQWTVGAIATITQSLSGNKVFVARLLNTNSHVLVHPVPYFDKRLGPLQSFNYDVFLTQDFFLSTCSYFM